MANSYTSSSLYGSTDTIIVNGIKMSMSEYRKQIKAKKNIKTKKVKKELTDINLLPNEIKYMMRNVRLLKSLSAYYNNGYRQWGRIAKLIINQKEISSPFVKFNAKQTEIEHTINEIKEISKHNEKAVYAFVRKLSYQLDDIKEIMVELCKGVGSSGVISQFINHECINGEGRRLGLRILMSRSYKAAVELEKIIRRCQNISDKGIDALDYQNETYNGLISTWSKKN